MTDNVRSPLINRWTDNILNRNKGTGLTAYAVGKIFSGASIARNTDLDTVTAVGIWRILHPTVIQNNIPSISDITGFLQVMDINRDEETNGVYKNIRRIRQIIYPDKADESSPYTRVGESATVNGPITWSDWAMMGGGSLRRVVTSVDVPKALNNVMYEVFTDGLTITLPAAENVPIGTKIGVEQYVGSGKVVCGGQEQITECDIKVYEPSEVTSPVMVSRWTAKPKSETPLYCRSINIRGTDPIDDSTGLSISGSEIENGDGTTFVSIDGQYALARAGVGQSRVWKHKTENIYGIYDTQSMTWKFVISSNNLITIDDVLYEAEYSFKSADALVYVFECALAQDGVTKEWLLDVDNNFAKAVGVLGDRIANVESDINKINDLEPYLHLIRTRTTRHITNPSATQLVCNVPASDSIEDKVAKLKENNNNIYFYDFVVSVTNSRTINLPTTNVPLGAVVCIEVIGNITVNVVSGEYTDEYVGTAGKILMCEFEYTKISSTTTAWTILSLGEASSYPDVDPDEPDPVVPVLSVVTPVNVTGLTEGVAMTPVQLSAYVENGLSSGITFASTDIISGLTLSSSGVISGTPLVSGDISMNVVVSYPGAESKSIVVNFDINTALTNLFASVSNRVVTLEKQSASVQTKQRQHEIDPAAHSALMADVATVDEVNTLSTAIDDLIVMIEEKENSISPALLELSNIVTKLRSGDVSTLADKLGVPISIPLNDHDGVTRNYRIMMTSIDTDDTPGYEHNARFEFLDTVDTRVYSADNDSKYQTSDIRSYLTSEDADGFMVRLPSWLKNMIVPTNIKCVETYNSSATETLTDKVFLPSAWELCGDIWHTALNGVSTDHWFQEGTKSTYYTIGTGIAHERTRFRPSFSTGTYHSIECWTRTPELEGDGYVRIIGYEGGMSSREYSDTASDVAPAFVIA